MSNFAGGAMLEITSGPLNQFAWVGLLLMCEYRDVSLKSPWLSYPLDTGSQWFPTLPLIHRDT